MINEILKSRGIPALKSRGEMLDILQRNEYGFMPQKPESAKFIKEENVHPNFCAGKAVMSKITAELTLNGETLSFLFHSIIPKKEGKHPFFVSIGFDFEKTIPNKYLPIEEIIDNGFAVLHVFYGDVTKDNYDFNDGIAGKILGGKWNREDSECGKIAMWAWAAQRMLDYAYTEPSLDTERAIVCGHSRLGKTALLAGATDERFKYVYSNDSGCSGAAITRGKIGEQVMDICSVVGYWFCRKYYSYIEHEHEMPFDQHYLIASIAPRYAYVASAEEDSWADPDSEFLACAAASEAWSGGGFVAEDRLPKAGDVFHDGRIGYHLRSGCHYFSREDWLKFIEFFLKKESEENG